MYLRKNLDLNCCGVLFGFNAGSGHPSQLVDRIVHLIDEIWVKREFFTDTIIHLTPEELRRETPEAFLKEWPTGIAVWDATYIETDKYSGNFVLGAGMRSRSQKNSHLNVEIACTPGGRVITCGCKMFYSDEQENADIWYIFKYCGFGEWCKTVYKYLKDKGVINDEHPKLVIHGDRGMDDQCIPDEYKDIVEIKTPEFGDAKGFLTTLQANRSRRVTRFRNIIECINRRLKEVPFLF
jgi:hypothetical protein